MKDIAIAIILISAIYAVIRGIDVRFVLLFAGLLLCSLAGTPLIIFDEFQRVMGEGKIIGPICSAMGYAFILKATGCDKAMVQLIMNPIKKMKWLLIPGSCAVGFITNIAITSQTASAAAVGPIIVPILTAAGFHPLIAGSALVLGCSVGGNLLNPGEPDIVGVQIATSSNISTVLDAALIPELIAFSTAIFVFTMLAYYKPPHSKTTMDILQTEEYPKTNVIKALMPLLPVITLLVFQSGNHISPFINSLYPNGLPVPHVMVFYGFMLILMNWKQISQLTSEFFSGLGYGYTHVISLIITASCFIAGLEAVGVLKSIVLIVSETGPVSKVMSGMTTFLMAILSGSGTAPSIAFSKGVLPSISIIDTLSAIDLGIIGAIGATLGRTMSPAAAVILYASTIIGCSPMDIVKRTWIPVCSALIITLIYFIFK